MFTIILMNKNRQNIIPCKVDMLMKEEVFVVMSLKV